jgi:serine/threonine-protein kinase
MVKKFFQALFVVVLLMVVSVLIPNLDIVARAFKALQGGNFTVERLRLDIASFDLGQKSPVIPIRSKVSPKDGMVQLYVPNGEFVMGTNDGFPMEAPAHAVYLNAFWIDQTEVTNAMYEKCMREKGCSSPSMSDNPYFGKWIYRDHPVVYIEWEQAAEYCQWAGRELPTEAQWEKAARGTDERNFPWGKGRPNPRLANFNESLIGGSVSVFRYPLGASPYGALNMVGNVREWVADWFSRTYYQISPYANPAGPETGTERSMRSGAYDANANEITTTRRYKHEPQSAGLSRGFRCAEESG